MLLLLEVEERSGLALESVGSHEDEEEEEETTKDEEDKLGLALLRSMLGVQVA